MSTQPSNHHLQDNPLGHGRSVSRLSRFAAASSVAIVCAAVAGPAAASNAEDTWVDVDGPSFGVTASSTADDVWSDIDGPSLGVTTPHDVAWCLADAGSLGHPDPVAACEG